MAHSGSDAVSREGQKALVRRFVDEVITRGDLELTNRLLAPDYAYHAPGMEVRGPEGITQVFRTLRGAFPDWSETVEDLVAEGDRVVFRVTGRGTHRGEFMGRRRANRCWCRGSTLSAWRGIGS